MKMVQTTLARPPPNLNHVFEDQTPQELSNTSDTQGEVPIELYIEDILQSCEGGSGGRGTPDSWASPQDPFTEVATTINGIQGTDSTSQGEIEVDLEIISELLLMEEKGKLDPTKGQTNTKNSQINGSNSPEVTSNHGHWSQDEHYRFLQGLEQYGRQWKRISLLVGTRTPIQVRTHAQKLFLNDPELEERSKCPEPRPVKRQRDESCKDILSSPHNGRWLEHEHELFLLGIKIHGKNWPKVASMVQSRTVLQIRSHAQKYFQKIEKNISSSSGNSSNYGHWSQDEHYRFLQGLEQYGRQWKRISLLVGTRTPTQVRTHAQKSFLNDPELEERSKCPEPRPVKRQRDESCKDISSSPHNGRWLEHEHELFLLGIKKHGKNWQKVASMVQSRTVLQIRSHAQKYFQNDEKSLMKTSV